MVALQRLWLRLWNGILAPKIAMEQLMIVMQLKIHLIHGTSPLISLHIPQLFKSWVGYVFFMLDRMRKNIKHQDPHVLHHIYFLDMFLSQINIYNMIKIYVKRSFIYCHFLVVSFSDTLQGDDLLAAVRGFLRWINRWKKNGVDGVDLGEIRPLRFAAICQTGGLTISDALVFVSRK